MHRHSISQQVPPIYEAEPQNDRSMVKNRKMSTGGNRSWSEEEESYLLRTRAQKMPYKHIAAHLNKTELACRLHYHQLSHGSHRRRRSASVASTMSSASSRTTPSQYSMNSFEDSSSRGMSPVSSISPRSRASSVVSMNMPPAHLSRSQKPLLPKPLSQPPTVIEEPPLTALRIQQEGVHPHHHERQQSDSVDTNRLRAIYEAHRTKFWDSIANEYGAEVSAQQLEHVWKQGGSGTPSLPNFPQRPPTPDSSPDTTKMTHPTLPRLTTSTTHQAPLPREYGMTPASSAVAPPPFHFPQYSHPSASAIEPSASAAAFKHSVPTSAMDYHRHPYPAPPAARPNRFESETSAMSRSESRDSNGVPATKIAAILTEDREPRRDTESPKAEEVVMRDA